MKNQPIYVETADGSRTLFHPQVGEHYHSRHGAVQESRHVFVNMGLDHFLGRKATNDVSILEVGFGTGLNFLLTADYASSRGIPIRYRGIEPCPLPMDAIMQMGHHAYVSEGLWEEFLAAYQSATDAPQSVGTTALELAHCPVLDFRSAQTFDVLYFDAFASVHQPDMWNNDTLTHATSFLKPGGIFVTYAITGNLKRILKALEFDVEKVPGAPGKREMLRATKHKPSSRPNNGQLK